MVAAILLVAVSGAASAGEYTEVARTPAEVKRGDECDRLHAELRKKLPDDERAQRDAWVAEKPRCAGTGQIETGEKALNALLRNNPSMKDNAGVIQLQKFFASKKPAGPATPAAP